MQPAALNAPPLPIRGKPTDIYGNFSPGTAFLRNLTVARDREFNPKKIKRG
jgi:hypothetical protein